MIVFWRLLLAYYLADFVFYNRAFLQWHRRKKLWGGLAHGAAFYLICCGLTWPYLAEPWPFLDLFPLQGWLTLLLFSAFHVLSDRWFYIGKEVKYHHTLTMLLHDGANLLFLFLCVPFDVLHHTGNPVAEPWVIFAVGLLFVTQVLGMFIYAVEKDKYGRDFPTPDERYISMLMRLIFFLIVLLPGWRWVLWFAVWLWACGVARRNRMMDFSRFALYFGAFAATAAGFLVKWSFYLQK